MQQKPVRFRVLLSAAPLARIGVLVLSVALLCAWNSALLAQQNDVALKAAPAAAPASQSAQQPAAQPPAQQTPAADQAPAEAPQQPAPGATPAAASDAAPASPAADTPQPPQAEPSNDATEPGGITEDELRKLLVGKTLYLRGGYLDNNLSFNEHGALIGHSPQGSYTLSGVEIDRVHLTKHKVELEGERYGLHFLGELPYEDPAKAVDRMNITPKKKPLKITVDRELVIKPKQKKEKEKGKPAATPAKSAPAAAAPPNAVAAAPAAQPSAAETEPSQECAAKEAQAEIAAAPAQERPADPRSVTTTISPAHATGVLRDALDRIFAEGLDPRMMAAMPDFWKLYYQAVDQKADYRPGDPGVLRQSMVDQKARLITKFEPASNQFAQDYGVAGMSLYHVVIGADGKPGEIAVARPIGFGLDESAVDSIRKAQFQPAMKDGKPVPVMLDLVVQFRIYSKRTAEASGDPAQATSGPTLPGPYTLEDKHQQP
jgi:Gram-negative bacterial TonB protein C-terminal